MRSFQTLYFTTKRLLQSDKKSLYIDNSSGYGHLKQLDERTSQLNNLQYGEGYSLMVEGDIDIIVTDRVTIDSVDYEVKGVKYDSFSSIDIKTVLLNKKKL